MCLGEGRERVFLSTAYTAVASYPGVRGQGPGYEANTAAVMDLTFRLLCQFHMGGGGGGGEMEGLGCPTPPAPTRIPKVVQQARKMYVYNEVHQNPTRLQ